MKVLIACEYSGIVREAFKALGHDAWSCDLLPSDIKGNHFQCDALEILHLGWDLMIAFPPCQYLSFAGMRFWNNEGRAEKREKAMQFFLQLYNAPIPKICVENPQGYPFTAFRKPDQVIHPYFFGDKELKRTCLWLKNLPNLKHSAHDTLFEKKTHTEKPMPTKIDSTGHKRYFSDSHYHKEVWKDRSKTFGGIARAMAEQWGKLNNTT